MVGLVLVASGGRAFSPGALNAETRGQVQLGGVSSHADLRGKCSACHTTPWSRQTMADRCLDCHTDVRQQLDAHGPMHGKLANGTLCRSCHSEHNGAHGSLTDFSKFNHDYAAFSLTGKHATADCKACHVNDTFRGTPQTCVACHAEPKAHMGQFGTKCANCHATNNWHIPTFTVPLSAGGHFDHDLTGFQLTGKHTTTDCKSCHVNNTFKGTPSSCISCHAEPKVHMGKFGTDCAKCHSTTEWHLASVPGALSAGGAFDHDKTAFKLIGKHKAVDCKSCHVNNTFKGTPTSCSSCHAEPKVHAGKFGTDCAKCHTPAEWHTASLPGVLAGGAFDHDKTSFPLTGKHKAVDCKSCHVNNTFKGTSTACSSCHAEPKVHMSKFGTDCAKCHTTASFAGATFKHTFPINHGNRRGNECTVCHAGKDNFKTYTCYGCHEHTPANVQRRHKNVANLDNCAKCHKGGRGRERERTAADVFGDAVCATCPATGEMFAALDFGEWSGCSRSVGLSRMLLTEITGNCEPPSVSEQQRKPADLDTQYEVWSPISEDVFFRRLEHDKLLGIRSSRWSLAILRLRD
jgi:hypothetical protein